MGPSSFSTWAMMDFGAPRWATSATMAIARPPLELIFLTFACSSASRRATQATLAPAAARALAIALPIPLEVPVTSACKKVKRNRWDKTAATHYFARKLPGIL